MTDEPTAGAAGRTIEDAYRECIEARIRFIENAGNAGLKPALHRNLHSAVMAWFETLHYELAAKDAVQTFWEDVEMWPTGYKQAPAFYCNADGCAFTRWRDEGRKDGLHDGATCPSCETGFLEEQLAPVYDEDGRLQKTYARGLQQLTNWYHRTTTVTKETKGYLGRRTKTVEVPQQLPVPILFKAARYLDEAADELDLLADVDDSAPESEFDMEQLEQFGEVVRELRAQAGTDTGGMADVMDEDSSSSGVADD